MNYSASIIDEAAPLKTSPAKRNLPANVVAMPGGVIPSEIVAFPKPVKREVMAAPTREEVRAEDRRLAIDAQGGCLQSFERLGGRFENRCTSFSTRRPKTIISPRTCCRTHS